MKMIETTKVDQIIRLFFKHDREVELIAKWIGELVDRQAVDAVEVVRCADCVNYRRDTDYCQKHNKGYCSHDAAIKPKDHYCGYGERKE